MFKLYDMSVKISEDCYVINRLLSVRYACIIYEIYNILYVLFSNIYAISKIKIKYYNFEIRMRFLGILAVTLFFK